MGAYTATIPTCEMLLETCWSTAKMLIPAVPWMHLQLLPHAWTASCLLPGQCKLQQRSVSVGCPMNLACGLLGCIGCPHCFCWSLAIVGATTTKGHAQPQSQYLPGKSFTALVCGCRKKIMRSASYPASLTSSSRGCLHCHHTNL